MGHVIHICNNKKGMFAVICGVHGDMQLSFQPNISHGIIGEFQRITPLCLSQRSSRSCFLKTQPTHDWWMMNVIFEAQFVSTTPRTTHAAHIALGFFGHWSGMTTPAISAPLGVLVISRSSAGHRERKFRACVERSGNYPLYCSALRFPSNCIVCYSAVWSLFLK